MANPNPSPETRFGGTRPNPSRSKQKGDRDRLSAAFLKALGDDFEQHGEATIKALREKDPSTYIRVVAGLQPKTVEIEEVSPESRLSDEQVEAIYQELWARFEAKKAQARH
jgi:hypothetical protein